ncbi:MAG: putative 36.7 kDa protein [uncultured marine phage]|uniref:Putative 36.7 kDa protein n=1 Tax=uncultured marine phage TaxID=707152 RepID=A0A8D9CAD3_9VIRU|nr:MAG: putative 36.7 kDa protein [uncultured marine phage]
MFESSNQINRMKKDETKEKVGETTTKTEETVNTEVPKKDEATVTLEVIPDVIPKVTQEVVDEKLTYDINTRFEFLEKLTKMVAKKKTESLIVTGEGGLGKTFTVEKVVKKSLKSKKIHIVKGYSTPRALYNILYDNNGKLIVFDDCDSILENNVSLNILKSALDSYDTRQITWATQMRKGDMYPQTFIFRGQIIFISNKKRTKINQAIASRSMVVDLSMTKDEKIERMKAVLKKVLPKVSMKAKKQSISLIEKHKEEIVDLNFRTLIKVAKIRDSYPKKWEELATYAMFEGNDLEAI